MVFVRCQYAAIAAKKLLKSGEATAETLQDSQLLFLKDAARLVPLIGQQGFAA